MSPAADLLTPSEAAAVAGVPVRAVNRAIDEHIIPKRLVRTDGGRWVRTDACAYIRFFFHAAEKLTADERRRVIDIVEGPHGRPAKGEVVDGFLTVNFDRFIEETSARHAMLRRAREFVTEDASSLGGAPVLKGTRIPVHDIAASVAAEIPLDRIKAAYPGLSDEQIELAALYADANPLRGRPRRRSADDLELVVDRTVARRRRP